MKNKCIVDIQQKTYNQLVFISNELGITINELLSKIMNDEPFTTTIEEMFKLMVNHSVKKPKKTQNSDEQVLPF